MYKTRCSAIGLIMKNPKSKKEKLSQTTKSHIKEIIIQDKFQKYKEINSKYLKKGNDVELDGIALCNSVMNLEFLYKNHDSFEDEWIKGTPDVNTQNVLLDIKSSWDAFTFPFFEHKIPKEDYMYQLQGYMHLTGKKEAYLCYCLLNTPDDIVKKEVRDMHYRKKMTEESEDITKFVQNNHNFDNIPDQLRVKSFKIEYDEEIIEKIIERIEDCREYYNQLNELLTIKQIENA